MIWLIVVVFISIVLTMTTSLCWRIQKNNLEEETRKEKLKTELDYLAMKNATKLSYGEKQRLDFALGKHWKGR